MPNTIDRGSKNDIFQAFVAVLGHHDEIGMVFADGGGDFMGRAFAMTDDHLDWDALLFERGRDAPLSIPRLQ